MFLGHKQLKWKSGLWNKCSISPRQSPDLLWSPSRRPGCLWGKMVWRQSCASWKSASSSSWWPGWAAGTDRPRWGSGPGSAFPCLPPASQSSWWQRWTSVGGLTWMCWGEPTAQRWSTLMLNNAESVRLDVLTCSSRSFLSHDQSGGGSHGFFIV